MSEEAPGRRAEAPPRAPGGQPLFLPIPGGPGPGATQTCPLPWPPCLKSFSDLQVQPGSPGRVSSSFSPQIPAHLSGPPSPQGATLSSGSSLPETSVSIARTGSYFPGEQSLRELEVFLPCRPV